MSKPTPGQAVNDATPVGFRGSPELDRGWFRGTPKLELLPQDAMRSEVRPNWFLRSLLCISGSRLRRFRLTADFVYVTSWGAAVVVPAGTIVNGASIPWFWWRLIGNPWGPYAESSIVHDWLWSQAARGQTGYGWANTVFLDALITQRIAPWRRRLIIAAVEWHAARIERRLAKARRRERKKR